MSSLKWTKSYEVLVQNKCFRILISRYDGNEFHASCLWYGGRVLRAHGQTGSLNFYLEKRLGNSEQDALDQILNWVKTKFGENFDLKET